MITKNKVVSLTYDLRINPQANVIESVTKSNPLEFICGQGQLMDYFEMNLLNKNAGDKFEFKIPAVNAYGHVMEDMIVDIPKTVFNEIDSAELKIGNSLPMMDSIGRKLQGKILEIGESDVRLDFNHPMAGNDLWFTGEILDVREATDEELKALNSGKCGGCSGCGSHDHEHSHQGGDCGGGCCC